MSIRASIVQKDARPYRMDTMAPGERGYFQWNDNLLSQMGEDIVLGDLTILAWTTREVEGDKQNVYVPVRIVVGGGKCAAAELIWLPRRSIEDLRVSARPVGFAGAVMQHSPAGFFSAQQPLRIKQNKLVPDDARGYYRIDGAYRRRVKDAPNSSLPSLYVNP